MLKIKDNVDLKELEKFSFEKWTRELCCNKYAYIYDCKGKKTIKSIVTQEQFESISYKVDQV